MGGFLKLENYHRVVCPVCGNDFDAFSEPGVSVFISGTCFNCCWCWAVFQKYEATKIEMDWLDAVSSYRKKLMHRMYAHPDYILGRVFNELGLEIGPTVFCDYGYRE